MSPVEACRVCGGIFAFLPRGVCADCIDEREGRYRDVRDWLLDNRGASILQASAATGVEESLIMEFLREGRLEVVGSEPVDSRQEEEEEVKARIRRELAARGGDAAGGAEADAAAGARLGMRSRAS